MIVPIALAAGVAAAYIASQLSRPPRDKRPDFRPDKQVAGAEQPLGVAPDSTGFSKVDGILDELKQASASAKVPLGLLVGWVAKESGGALSRGADPKTGDTELGERGYFQLLPEESKAIHVDHSRLSTDGRYSINAGLALIGRYMGEVDRLDIAPRGSSYYWKLVKLMHSMGPDQVRRVVARAKAANRTSSWDVLETFALGLDVGTPRPRDWFPFVDRVFDTGRPFGFGNDTHIVAGFGGAAVVLPYADIPDPLDVLAPRVDSPPTS